MARSDHQYYYSRRSAEEMERGDRAANPTVAAVHYELACRYAILAAWAGSSQNELVAHAARRQLAA